MNSKNYFDKVANQWDQLRESFFSETVREVALSTAEAQAGRSAADIGAGTGFITEGLLQKGLKVIAVDQSQAMLEKMKTKFKKFDSVEYRIGDSHNLPIPDETVDYVFTNMYLHHVESPQIAIQEMVRLLKPGGKIIITDLDEHDFEFLRKEQNDRWLGFRREDIRRWFEEAGLKEVQISCVGEDCCAESEDTPGRAKVSIFVASGVK
jgi:ubiquinone/menaquinone biosynthesis C-methylase UbiE